jgi:flagellar basal-body rod protein FlgF
MENPLYIGLSRQVALRRQLEVVANNIANMNTVGFRADRVLFDAAMEQAGQTRGDRIALTIDKATYTDTSQGTFVPTGNALDVAISGDGWLGVATPDGLRYTRDGRMQRNEAGELVNLNGYPVLDDGGQPLVIPEDRTAISIAPDGTVTADGEVMARLGLSAFAEPQAMIRGANGLYEPGDQDPQPAPEAKLAQGNIESSNVQAVVEMTRMMDMTRDYQAVSRMVEEGHELLRGAIGRLGRTTSGV